MVDDTYLSDLYGALTMLGFVVLALVVLAGVVLLGVW